MTHKASLVLFWLLLALVVFWTLSPVSLRPQFGRPALERAGAFFALGGALATAYPRRLLVVAAVIAAIAVGSEALQLLIASRHARPIDGAEKTLGGLIGVAAVALGLRYRRQPPL